MGKVVLVYRLMPDGPDVDLKGVQDQLKSVLPQGIELAGSQIKPVAFGISALLVRVVGPDKEGVPDSIEAAFGKLPGIQNVDIVEQSLM